MKFKIILFENQRLYLESLECLLQRSDLANLGTIHGISSFQDLEKNILDKETILFFNIGNFSSVEVTTHIEKFLELNPSLKIIIHSHYAEARMIKKVFDKGVKSYLGNNTSSEEFLEALEQVMQGKIYVNEDAKNALFNFICNVDDTEKNSAPEELTAREKDVLHLICDGLRSKEIAEKLFISTHTVESHRRNMMLKFNINSSNQLVKFALENHLVEY